MENRKLVLIFSLSIYGLACATGQSSHSIIRDNGNTMNYLFYGPTGICGGKKCYGSEIQLNYPTPYKNFRFWTFDQIRFAETDPTTGKTIFCEATGPKTVGNSHIRLQKGCIVRVWSEKGAMNNWNTVQKSETKPAHW